MKNNEKNIVFISLILFFILPVSGCSKSFDFTGPVIEDPDEFKPVYSGFKYEEKDSGIENPIIPFKVFGLRIPEEIFIELKSNETWWTLEICNIGDDNWFILDAMKNKEQAIGSSENLSSDMVKDLPLKNYFSGLKVIREKGTKGEYTISYKSINNEEFLIQFKQRTKKNNLKKRNGSTMGHSEKQIWALVDVESVALGKAEVKINGKKQKIKYYIPLLVQNAFLICQTIAGIPSGEYTSVKIEEEISDKITSELNGKEILIVEMKSYPDGKIQYVYLKNGKYLELYSVKKISDKEIFRIDFCPAIPDLRYCQDSWDGRFAVSLNGIFGYSHGQVSITSEHENEIELILIPADPYWASFRSIINEIYLNSSDYKVKTLILILEPIGVEN